MPDLDTSKNDRQMELLAVSFILFLTAVFTGGMNTNPLLNKQFVKCKFTTCDSNILKGKMLKSFVNKVLHKKQ